MTPLRTMTSATADSAPAEICQAIKERTRFLITSHARPDGDSIGSQLAMAYALDLLGKQVRLVNADPAPEHYLEFPGVDRIEIAREATVDDIDAVIVMESGDFARTGVKGIEGRFTINIDHHQGNSRYGDINWLDESAAACGELVFELIRASAFRSRSISPRTSTSRSSPTRDRSITPTSRRERSTSAGRPWRPACNRRPWRGAYSTATASASSN